MRLINTFFTVIAGAFMLSLGACKKGGTDLLYNMDVLSVYVNGYNGSTEKLEMKLDTFKHMLPIETGSFNVSNAYSFRNGQSSVKLTIAEKGTGKILIDSLLKKENGPANISFFYFDGKMSHMPEVAPLEENKIKISYMFMPKLTNYTEPVDIVLGKYYFTPKVFEEITRIKNVQPYEFTKPVTISTFPLTGQTYNGQTTAVLFQVYIYKAGTNEFYTNGSPYTWHATSSSAPKPAASTASSKIYVFSESAAGNSIRFDKKLEL
jgi:hypothetical protein